MDLTNFSLLYPDAESQRRHHSGSDRPDVDAEVVELLGLGELIDLKNSDLCEYFTADPAVIAYRTETFSDMLAHRELGEMLTDLMPILGDVIELRRLEADSGDTESYLLSITEIELYISSIETLHRTLSTLRPKLTGRAFSTLADRIIELAESDYYRDLNRKLTELTSRVREIKSVTVGVNLDAQLRPKNAGVLSINNEPFKSGDVLEKILRLDFKNDDYTCIASLVPFGKRQTEDQKMALSLAFISAINEIYKSSLRSWKKIVQSYVLENTDFLLNLMPEIELLVKGTRLMEDLLARNCRLCTPTILPASERGFRAWGLYNPAVALKVEDEIVTNELIFDENASIYVLSGPNRGGKSVITCALGLAQAMMQLGLCVPAERAEISPCDGIFTHFPSITSDTIDKGRLGEECVRLNDIFDRLTDRSLVLLDESLSSTGSFEGAAIATEVLAGLSRAHCRCLFSTHLHELAAEIDRINARTAEFGGGKIDTLVAGIEEGRRSFKINRAKPDGKSYARDIAAKYGLSYESIMQKIEMKSRKEIN